MLNRVNVLDLFEEFIHATARPNPAPYSPIVQLEIFCMWLLERFDGADFEDDEGDWVQLWDLMGISGGDGADVVATTLSKSMSV